MVNLGVEYSLERKLRIYSSEDFSYIEIGPDNEGLGLIDIVKVKKTASSSMTEKSLITIDKKCAKLLVQALTEYIEKME